MSKKFLPSFPNKQTVIVCQLCHLSDGQMGPVIFQSDEEWRILLQKVRKFTSAEVVPVNNTINPVCEFCREQLDKCEIVYNEQNNEYFEITEIEPAEVKKEPVEQNETEPENMVIIPDILPVKIKNEPEIIKTEPAECDVKEEIKMFETVDVQMEVNRNDYKVEKEDGQENKPDNSTIELDSNDEKVETNIFDEDDESSSSEEERGYESSLDDLTLKRGKRQCMICRRWVWKMNEHFNTHTKEISYPCSECNRVFYIKSKLKEHMASHQHKKEYKCHECNATFKSAYFLKDHLIIHTDAKPFVCPFCPKKFKRRKDMTYHKKGHKNDIANDCEGCGRQFIKLSSLENHIKQNTEDVPFNCLKCDQTFARRCSLDIHIRANHLITKCGLCAENFVDPDILEIHILQKHSTNIKRFRCSRCINMHFETTYALEKHMKKHRNKPKDEITESWLRPYKCFFCNHRFKSVSCRDRHSRFHVVHEDETPQMLVRDLTPSPEPQPVVKKQPLVQIKIVPDAVEPQPAGLPAPPPPALNNFNYILNTPQTPVFGTIGHQTENPLNGYILNTPIIAPVANENFVMATNPPVVGNNMQLFPTTSNTDPINNLNYLNPGYYFFIVP